MTKRLFTLIENGEIGVQTFSFNNLLIRSPLRYTMMERRFLYKLSEAIKMRYEKMGLKMRENWNNLVFKMTDKDLASVGGKSNVVRTYETIRSLAQKSIVQFHQNEQNQLVIDYFHWIDAFRWNTATNDYTVRVSPELYDYVICLTKSFTVLNLHTAILLESKYSQKFYEFCCQYSGDFRFIDPTISNVIYKKRVVKMSVKTFRFTFGLSELHDPKIGELLEKEKYSRFKTMVEKVIIPAQNELYKLYQDQRSEVWFDFQVADRYGRGRGGSPKNFRFFIYTRKHPKSTDPTLDQPWKEGMSLSSRLKRSKHQSLLQRKNARTQTGCRWTKTYKERLYSDCCKWIWSPKPLPIIWQKLMRSSDGAKTATHRLFRLSTRNISNLNSSRAPRKTSRSVSLILFSPRTCKTTDGI